MMKKYIFDTLVILLTCFSCHGQVALPALQWNQQRIAPGVIWKWIQTNELFNSQQFINILEVKKKRKVSIAFEPKKLRPTSNYGKARQAIAAINAGFFNMKAGGSVTFLKVDDLMINNNTTRSNAITKSCIAIDEKDRLHIQEVTDSSLYQSPDYYDDVLFTGPLLIDHGERMSLSDRPFNSKRHPRTCLCILKNGKQLFMTVDGRSEQANGMSLFELTDLLKSLGCQSAINLDGGGSTTMWIQNFGVVNHPSDNKVFDHQGERSVANVILIQ